MKQIKSTCLSFMLLLFVPTLIAQTTIKGSVMSSNGKPINKASVFLPDTYEGGETDIEGRFSFTTDEKGEIILVANHLNYNPDTIRVEIKEGKSLIDKLVFILYSQNTIYLEEVVISSVSSMSVSESRSKNALTPLDVYTTPTANADLSLALRTTPGLQDVGYKEGFFVRGGAGNETGVVIDGVRVKNFFAKGATNVPSRSRMDPGMFKGMVLGIGGYSPQYGDALSGMMELTTSDMPDKSSISIGLSPIFASLEADFFGIDRKCYTVASYSYSNLYAIQPFLRKGWGFDPIGFGHALKMRNISKLSTNGELRLSLFADHSAGGVHKKSLNYDIGDMHFYNRENYLLSTLNYKHYIRSNMMLTITGGYSRNENRSQITNQDFLDGVAIKTVDDYKQLGVNLKINQGRFSSIQGVEYSHSELIFDDNSLWDGNWSAFFNGVQQLSNNWLLAVGLRTEYSTLLKSGIVLPRLSLTHTFTKNSTLTLDGGIYSQTANYFFPTEISSGGFFPVGREQSEQYNLTYQFFPIGGGRLFRFQLFNKQYHRLSQIRDELIVNNGKGYARGVDLFFMDSKSIKNFKYRFSYSYIDSEREFLYYPIMVQPKFVANHTASVVLHQYISKISSQFNLSFSFNSGFPYYNPNLEISEFMKERTPLRFNMDFSYNKLFALGSTYGVAILSVTNILGSNSVLSYQFSNTKNSAGIYGREAIISPMRPLLFVGVFFNIGTDRRQEIIDKYL